MVGRQTFRRHIFFLKPTVCYTYGAHMDSRSDPRGFKASVRARRACNIPVSVRWRRPAFRRTGMCHLQFSGQVCWGSGDLGR